MQKEISWLEHTKGLQYLHNIRDCKDTQKLTCLTSVEYKLLAKTNKTHLPKQIYTKVTCYTGRQNRQHIHTLYMKSLYFYLFFSNSLSHLTTVMRITMWHFISAAVQEFMKKIIYSPQKKRAVQRAQVYSKRGGFCKSNKVVKYAAEWAKLNVIQWLEY